MKTFLLVLLTFSCILPGWAQTRSFSGRVMDEAGNALPYVNVVLLNKTDSSFVRGVVTDEEGGFRIESEHPESQLLKFSSVGYQELFEVVRAGEVRLLPAAYAIDEVEIAGKRPVYRMKGTSFVTNVENSLLQDIGSANDVLRQIPGVTGAEGDFEVFGKGKAAIYIDDRLVRDPSELERIDSKNIASVELINNPGAGYDADTRAVLRIRLKKKREGFASVVRFRGTQNHYFSDLEQLNLSYGSERVNWYGLFYAMGLKSRVDGRNRIMAHTPDTLYRLSMDMMDWRQHGRIYTAQTGLGVKVARDQEVGASYAYSSYRDVYEGPDVERLETNGQLEELLSNDSYAKNRYGQHQVNAYYVGKWFDKLEVNLNADYIHRDAPTEQWVTERSGEADSREVNTLNTSLYDLYAAKVVFGYPLWTGKLELGMDISKMSNKQVYTNREGILADSRFDSDERKTAGFVNYAGKVGRLAWNAGLRYERFHASYFENDAPGPTVDRVYKELYPTLSVAYPAGPVSLSLAYTKRTARPTFYQLRNSVDYTSRFLYARGNPYLRSSQIHDLSLNVGYRFLQFTMGYYHTKDWIRMSDELLPGDPLAIVLSHTNEPKYRGMSAQLSFQHKIGFWSPTWSAGVYRNFWNLKGDNGNHPRLDSPYGEFSLNNTFAFGAGFLLNIDGSYTTAGAMEENRRYGEGCVNVGIRKSFFKGALNVNLQCADLFKTARSRSVIYTERLAYDRWNYRDARSVRLTLTWYYNKYRRQYKGQNSAASEMDRM